MARTVTLGEIRTQAKRRADMEHTEFVTNEGWNEFINQSYAKLYDIIISSYEDYYLKDPLDVTIAPGSSTIDLPTDFYKLKGLDYQDGLSSVSENNWIDVRKFNFKQRNRTNNLNRIVGNNPFRQYRILGDKIHILPKENAPGNYRIWYNPPITTLVNDTDEIDGVNGWEEFIIVDAAIKALAKEESSTTELQKELGDLMTRIKASAETRDISEPNVITDCESNDYLGYDSWGY